MSLRKKKIHKILDLRMTKHGLMTSDTVLILKGGYLLANIFLLSDKENGPMGCYFVSNVV